ncbi:hypothetical protein ACFX15_041972 [Malus domestica]
MKVLAGKLLHFVIDNQVFVTNAAICVLSELLQHFLRDHDHRKIGHHLFARRRDPRRASRQTNILKNQKFNFFSSLNLTSIFRFGLNRFVWFRIFLIFCGVWVGEEVTVGRRRWAWDRLSAVSDSNCLSGHLYQRRLFFMWLLACVARRVG